MSEIVIDPNQLLLKDTIHKMSEMVKAIPEDQKEAHIVIEAMLSMLTNYEKMAQAHRVQIANLKHQLEVITNQNNMRRIK